MAIKRGSKVNASYSSASMTDIVFLLLVFLLITTTLINPNALKLQLPKSSNQMKEKAMTSVSITHDLRYYIENTPVQFDQIEPMLKERLGSMENPMFSLHCDKTVPVDEVVKMMNIALRNNYQMKLATDPE